MKLKKNISITIYNQYRDISYKYANKKVIFDFPYMNIYSKFAFSWDNVP